MRRLGIVPLFLFAVANVTEATAPEGNRPAVTGKRQLKAELAKRPLSFEENRGQTDPAVKFLSRGRGYTLYLTPGEAVLALEQGSLKQGSDEQTARDGRGPAEDAKPAWDVLRMQLEGSSPDPKMTGLDALRARSHYLVGNDPENRHRDVPHFSRVRYADVYPGVDLVYYGNRGRPIPDGRGRGHPFRAVQRDADQHVIRVYVEQQYFNLDAVRVVSGG